MNKVTAVIWNIETFGAFSPAKRGPDNLYVLGTLSFIRHVLQALDAEVLVIQEFRNDGVIDLIDLRTFLNEGIPDTSPESWSFDCIPGAIQPGRQAISCIDDLWFNRTANSEGYAVLWKAGRLLPFQPPEEPKMSLGKNADEHAPGFINLANQGAEPVFTFGGIPPITHAPGCRFDAMAAYPPPSCRAVSNPSSIETRRGTYDNNVGVVLRQDTVRFPSRVKLHLPWLRVYVDLVTYHAPVSDHSPLYGVMALALCRQLAENPQTGVIVAGDFNLTEQQEFLQLPVILRDLNLVKGTEPLPEQPSEWGYARTQVQFRDWLGRLKEGLQDCYEHPRDTLFYRKTIRNVLSCAYNVPFELVSRSPFGGHVFQDPYIWRQLKSALAHDSLPPDIRAMKEELLWPFSHENTRYDAGSIAAAVLYRGLVSDHLPLVVSIGR